MDNMKFTQVLPRLRVLETKLLDKSKIDRMVDSKSAVDALRVLQETPYSEHITDSNKAQIYEDVLSKELICVYSNLYKMTPFNEVVDVMALKYTYHNIKVLIKGKILGKDFSNILIPICNENLVKIKYALDNMVYRDLDKFTGECIKEALNDFEINKDPQRIDTIVDKYQFMQILDKVKLINNLHVDKYINALIDLTNIKTLLRVKKQNKNKDFLNHVLIKGGNVGIDRLQMLLNEASENIPMKLSYTNYETILRDGIADFVATSSVSKLEALVDNYIMSMMKDAKYITSGPMPIIAYIYAKENEIKLIRTVMVGKLNNISEDLIRERLRDSYV
ncbi:MAG: V-type ATP synthase subunit C [Sarcina sp.]